MSNEVDQKLAEKLQHDGPWFVTADGATSKGHSLVTIDCTNAQDDVIHLALIDGGYNRLDAVWLKQQLREQLERLPAVAGVSQDTARVCKKAWKELHRDLRAGNPARWRSLAYIDCGEHVSQLVAADMAKEIPWLQDCRFSCLALIFCYHGCFLSRYLKAQRMSMFSSVSPPSFPPFPLRPSGGACAGAPRPLPGVVAHGRGCVRRQPRPFPSFLSDSSSLPSPSFWGCVCWCSTSFAWSGGPWQRVRATPATSLPFLSDSSSLPSPSFWGCVCWCSTSSAWSGGPWQRVRATPATSLPFLSDSSSLPSPSFWGCVCWCSTSSAWSGGPWQRVRATPATSLPFLSFWLPPFPPRPSGGALHT